MYLIPTSLIVVILATVLALVFHRSILLGDTRLVVGQVYNGWELTRTHSKALDISDATAYLFKHLETNASYLHIDSPSESNNLFSLSFSTMAPNSDNGLVHILEHLCLCGSVKFPVRDPFFSMIKRSLQTYMNAYTAQDYTTYLYSTQYEKDYFNLMQIYIDAVFNPLLRELDFMQEAYHYAFNDNSSLEYRGIVFNEMKGAMSDPTSYFLDALNRLLFHKLPGNTNSPFGYNNGGDPLVIPSLTYDQLKAYHAKYYSPSNSFFYTYGNIDVRKHLQSTDASIPRKHQETHVNEGSVNVIASTNTLLIYGPVEAASTNTSNEVKFAIAWNLGDLVKNSHETYALQVFSTLLLHNPRGPMYKALIESNLAPDYLSAMGFEAGDNSFVIGVTGVKCHEDITTIETVINETLLHVSVHGFDAEHVGAEINSIELEQKKVSPYFGMTVGSVLIPFFFHGGDVFKVLERNKNLEEFKRGIKKPDFFQNLARKYLIENEKRVTLTMIPDPLFTEKQKELESMALSSVESRLSDEEKEVIRNKTEALRHHQESQETNDQSSMNDVLPTLHSSDIPRDNLFSIDTVRVGTLTQFAGNNSISFNSQSVSDLVYLTVFSELSLDHIPDELLDYIPILGVITQLGAGNYTRYELSQFIDQATGGIAVAVELAPALSTRASSSIFKFGISLESNAAFEQVDQLLHLIDLILSGPHWNETQYLSVLLEQMHVQEYESIIGAGNIFAESTSSQHLSDFDLLSERLSGLTQVAFIERLLKQDPKSVAEKLRTLFAMVFRVETMSLFVTCEGYRIKVMTEKLILLMEKLYARSVPVEYIKYPKVEHHIGEKHRFIGKSLPINFVARCYRTVPYLHTDHAALSILGAVLSPELHKEIREKGGAYGSKASLDFSGLFRFSTYRDPNTVKSFEAFEKVIAWACNRTDSRITDLQIDESKLKAFQSIDSPKDPHSRVRSWFPYFFDEHVITDKLRKDYRAKLLAVTETDIVLACRNYLEIESVPSKIAIIGNKEEIPKAIVSSSDWRIDT